VNLFFRFPALARAISGGGDRQRRSADFLATSIAFLHLDFDLVALNGELPQIAVTRKPRGAKPALCPRDLSISSPGAASRLFKATAAICSASGARSRSMGTGPAPGHAVRDVSISWLKTISVFFYQPQPWSISPISTPGDLALDIGQSGARRRNRTSSSFARVRG
jgi:hypothetical protein